MNMILPKFFLAGPEFLRRFEIERQLMATLSHNNITRLLDGGVSSSGDPYLITEFVEGEPLDRYADSHKLDVDARLRLGDAGEEVAVVAQGQVQ